MAYVITLDIHLEFDSKYIEEQPSIPIGYSKFARNIYWVLANKDIECANQKDADTV